MTDSIEQILSTLVIKVAEHFGFEIQEAIASVAQSKTAYELTKGNFSANTSLDQICQRLYKEISMAE